MRPYTVRCFTEISAAEVIPSVPISAAILHPDSFEGSLVGELAAVLGERRPTLAANPVPFARVLRAADFDVTSGRVIDAARSLALIEVSDRNDFHTALRGNLVSRFED